MMANDTEKIACLKCGAENLCTDKVCVMCGAVLHDSAPNVRTENDIKSDLRSKIANRPTVITAVCAVALIGVFAVFAISAWFGDASLREEATAASDQNIMAFSSENGMATEAGVGGMVCAVGDGYLVATPQGIVKIDDAADVVDLVEDSDACYLCSNEEKAFYISDADYSLQGNPYGFQIRAIDLNTNAESEMLYEASSGKSLSDLCLIDDRLYFLESADNEFAVISIDFDGANPEVVFETESSDAWLSIDSGQIALLMNKPAGQWEAISLDIERDATEATASLSGAGTIACASIADSRYYFATVRGSMNSSLKMQSLSGSFADYQETGPISSIAAISTMVAYGSADGSIGWLNPSSGISHNLYESLVEANIALDSAPSGIGIHGSWIVFRDADENVYQIDVNSEEVVRLNHIQDQGESGI